MDSTELDAINQALDQDQNIKAIGEIGLDFHWDRSPRDRQRSAFQAQLDLARDRNIPVVIHSREAEEETLDILLDMGFQDRPLLWHCFGGDSSLAEQILARGWMVSIPGTVTFPKSRALQEAVRGIPLQQMVLETDCPFLAPEPYRSKRNEPAYSVFTAQKIAEERQAPLTDIWEQTGQTAREFFGLDDAK